MSSFEYVMVRVSIVIGLAITHLLTALSAAVHRLRGHGDPIRLEAVYLLWTGYVLIWLVSFWWWEYKFQEITPEWSFGLYLFIISYAVSPFLLAAVLVPAGMDRVADSYTFFVEGRKWFCGVHLLVIDIDIMDSFLKDMEWGSASRSTGAVRCGRSRLGREADFGATGGPTCGGGSCIRSAAVLHVYDIGCPWFMVTSVRSQSRRSAQ